MKWPGHSWNYQVAASQSLQQFKQNAITRAVAFNRKVVESAALSILLRTRVMSYNDQVCRTGRCTATYFFTGKTVPVYSIYVV